jgi:hypothetical protein
MESFALCSQEATDQMRQLPAAARFLSWDPDSMRPAPELRKGGEMETWRKTRLHYNIVPFNNSSATVK